MNPSSIIKIMLLVLFGMFYSAFAQTDTTAKYITVVPGAEYEAGWLHEVFFGSHWRDLWTTPLKVEILNLNNFAGGLTPVKRGGGKQTKSLRFKGEDGHLWKFRSVNKDPSSILPLGLRETIADDIVQDQISTSNPLAPLVVFSLLDAVNLLEAQAKLVYLPNDEKLGEFREEFGGMLGFIELHPDEGADDEPGFAGAIDVKGTYKLLNYLEKKRSEKINAQQLKERDHHILRMPDLYHEEWDTSHLFHLHYTLPISIDPYACPNRQGEYPLTLL